MQMYDLRLQGSLRLCVSDDLCTWTYFQHQVLYTLFGSCLSPVLACLLKSHIQQWYHQSDHLA